MQFQWELVGGLMGKILLVNDLVSQHLDLNFIIHSCAESNLNGVYHNEPKSNHSMNFSGIFWEHWLGDYSLKATKMMVRPKDSFNSFINDEDLIEFNKSVPLEDP